MINFLAAIKLFYGCGATGLNLVPLKRSCACSYWRSLVFDSLCWTTRNGFGGLLIRAFRCWHRVAGKTDVPWRQHNCAAWYVTRHLPQFRCSHEKCIIRVTANLGSWRKGVNVETNDCIENHVHIIDIITVPLSLLSSTVDVYFNWCVSDDASLCCSNYFPQNYEVKIEVA